MLGAVRRLAAAAQRELIRAALALAQVDPSSPSYHAWLTPEQYAARFGARSQDIALASSWLEAQGFVVHRTSRLGTRVTFSGKVSNLEAAFQTEMHRYLVRGETHYAMATAPAVPAELASFVLGLRNTHDFYPRPVSRVTNNQAFDRRGIDPHFGQSFEGGMYDSLGPPDWAAASMRRHAFSNRARFLDRIRRPS